MMTIQRPQRVPDPLIGSQGDERERAVYNAGGTRGMYIGFLLCLVTALGFALFGHILVPMVLIVVAAVPGWLTITYSEKRNVDAFAIIARSNSRAAAASGFATLVLLLLMAAAMFYTTVTGSGLLEFEIPQSWADRFVSVGNGVAVGAAVGAVGGYLGTAWLIRRRRKQQEDELSAPDED